MVSGTWHYRGAARFGAVAAILALTGCSSVNPVHWYKDIVGPKPDASAAAPETTPMRTADANSEEPYPSLATVPPPATLGLSEAQRTAMADGLVADRKNAKYAEEQAEVADAVPMPPAPAAFTPGPTPEPSAPDAMGTPDQASPPPPPAPIRKAKAKKNAAPSAVEKALAASGLSSGGPFDHAPVAPAPRESPEPDNAAAPPDAPSLPPVPVSAPSSAPAPAAQATDTAVPEAPALAAAPAEKAAGGGQTDSPGVATSVASIHFAAGSTTLPADAAANLAPVAGALARSGGKVHVISHASSDGDASASLESYQAALARAKAVKQGLIATGIPDSSITTEVSSSMTSEANDTAEVLVGK